MTIFLIIIHVIACIALIGLVLIQRGRGGGLVESFSNVESMFGPKTSAFLTKATSILSVVFFFTCLSLAILSVRQSRSLMRGLRSPERQKPPVTAPVNKVAGEIPVPQAKIEENLKVVEQTAAPAKEATKGEAAKQEPVAQPPVKSDVPKETPKTGQ